MGVGERRAVNFLEGRHIKQVVTVTSVECGNTVCVEGWLLCCRYGLL